MQRQCSDSSNHRNIPGNDTVCRPVNTNLFSDYHLSTITVTTTHISAVVAGCAADDDEDGALLVLGLLECQLVTKMCKNV
jgi:hypothetical protein